jgi:hypothetical protein
MNEEWAEFLKHPTLDNYKRCLNRIDRDTIKQIEGVGGSTPETRLAKRHLRYTESAAWGKEEKKAGRPRDKAYDLLFPLVYQIILTGHCLDCSLLRRRETAVRRRTVESAIQHLLSPKAHPEIRNDPIIRTLLRKNRSIEYLRIRYERHLVTRIFPIESPFAGIYRTRRFKRRDRLGG